MWGGSLRETKDSYVHQYIYMYEGYVKTYECIKDVWRGSSCEQKDSYIHTYVRICLFAQKDFYLHTYTCRTYTSGVPSLYISMRALHACICM